MDKCDRRIVLVDVETRRNSFMLGFVLGQLRVVSEHVGIKRARLHGCENIPTLIMFQRNALRLGYDIRRGRRCVDRRVVQYSFDQLGRVFGPRSSACNLQRRERTVHMGRIEVRDGVKRDDGIGSGCEEVACHEGEISARGATRIVQ